MRESNNYVDQLHHQQDEREIYRSYYIFIKSLLLMGYVKY